jgi:hypothetical protein
MKVVAGHLLVCDLAGPGAAPPRVRRSDLNTAIPELLSTFLTAAASITTCRISGDNLPRCFVNVGPDYSKLQANVNKKKNENAISGDPGAFRASEKPYLIGTLPGVWLCCLA